ncbi:MAG: formimidoylglutamase [Crocinitomicaceae bacterium]
MKDISIYFQALSADFKVIKNSIGESIIRNNEVGFPEIKPDSIVVFDIPEYRNSSISYSTNKNSFRTAFYELCKGENWSREVYDIGTVMPGGKIEDTYFALSQIVSELVKHDVIPVLIGGGQDLTLSCYKGFESLERMINICALDNQFDIGDPNEGVNSKGYVSHLLMQRPCYLFNYSTIGIQRPFVKKNDLDLFEKLYFDICRLGEFNADFKKAEPHLRNADVLSIDFGSIKSSETDASCYKNPNGFYAEQVCQLSKYAGISDKMSCFGIFDVDPLQNDIAASLIAQMIWYFIDGVSQRVGDFPIGSKKAYTKFLVHTEEASDELVFYKSNKSERWWLEVKYTSAENNLYERHCMVPCDRQDYDNALANVIPDLWWKTLQKLS